MTAEVCRFARQCCRPHPQAEARSIERLVPHESALHSPLVQLGSSQFGSNLVANCAIYADFAGLSGY